MQHSPHSAHILPPDSPASHQLQQDRQLQVVGSSDDGHKDARNILRQYCLQINYYLLLLVGLTFTYLSKMHGHSNIIFVKVEFTPQEIECLIRPHFLFENSVCETEIQMASCSQQSSWKPCKESMLNEALYRKEPRSLANTVARNKGLQTFIF